MNAKLEIVETKLENQEMNIVKITSLFQLDEVEYEIDESDHKALEEAQEQLQDQQYIND